MASVDGPQVSADMLRFEAPVALSPSSRLRCFPLQCSRRVLWLPHGSLCRTSRPAARHRPRRPPTCVKRLLLSWKRAKRQAPAWISTRLKRRSWHFHMLLARQDLRREAARGKLLASTTPRQSLTARGRLMLARLPQLTAETQMRRRNRRTRTRRATRWTRGGTLRPRPKHRRQACRQQQRQSPLRTRSTSHPPLWTRQM